MPLNSENLFDADFANALVAFAAFVLSGFALWKAQKKEKIELANILAGIRRNQYEDIHQWGVEVIETMAQTSSLCEFDPARKLDFFDCRVNLIGRLSYLLDRGKLYLPNVKPEEIGVYKPGAYQGLRQQVLDELYKFHKKAEDLDYHAKLPNKGLQKELVNIRREFVSELQKTLQVRKIESELTEMVVDIKRALNHRDQKLDPDSPHAQSDS
ncbi:hypothetical protein SAMN05216327_11895 [Dyadobacter sp. SG02]|uniref:hypothetical protein n=1 Tax=Dyadobacter sp. SG02 TaxID=1855291 RepID=UPI0008B710BC|nr:hypothetical protein [Dyadobacter sp. SG02]SEJ75240.1 hypothetical protein SAMN05216327_11895 [Dyadobacter sp. SG02]